MFRGASRLTRTVLGASARNAAEEVAAEEDFGEADPFPDANVVAAAAGALPRDWDVECARPAGETKFPAAAECVRPVAAPPPPLQPSKQRQRPLVPIKRSVLPLLQPPPLVAAAPR